jgi:glycosyltransferase involved in cell wall biosynthesis
MKKRILVIGITMAAAGSEKSFLSFARHAIDYDKYEVDLLLAKKTGEFLPMLPREIRVLEMGPSGEIFLIDRNNASRIIAKRYLSKNPLRAFCLLKHVVRRKTAKTQEMRDFASNRIWVELLKKMPAVKEEYDAALAYWGDHTMFYMCDKVKAKKKIAWLHFDYAMPPREDALYLQYFKACDTIVTVSEKIESSLRAALPEIADKIVTVENIVDADEIRALAENGESYTDGFDGIRLLTVGRICPQKGYDLALPAVSRLVEEGYPLRWYIIGTGEDEDFMRRRVSAMGLQERVCFLGVKKNPYPYMKNADFYLQPSRHEGKPIAVEEAKILKKRIFVTNYSSAKEQLQNYFSYEIGEISTEGIYKGLKRMMDDVDFRRNISGDCATSMDGEKSLNRILDKLLE